MSLTYISKCSKVGPVTLPTQDQEFDVGTSAIVTGWGALTSAGGTPDELHTVELFTVDDDGKLHVLKFQSFLHKVDVP